MKYSTKFTTPLGTVILASDGEAINGLWFLDQKHFPNDIPRSVLQNTTVPVLQEAVSWLEAYWQGYQPSPALLPLAPRGTLFQRNIWQFLLQIPYGSTITYGQLAKQYAAATDVTKMSAQAVGFAIARNPVSIIIPCHRVIGATGGLVGYDGGIARKAALLKHEGIVL